MSYLAYCRQKNGFCVTEREAERGNNPQLGKATLPFSLPAMTSDEFDPRSKLIVILAPAASIAQERQNVG